VTSEKTTDVSNTDPRSGLPQDAGKRRPIRAITAAILLALAGAGFTIYQKFGTTAAEGPAQNNLYMPVVDPVLEPDRPDLIGDSLPED
jgi:hypothetical protein